VTPGVISDVIALEGAGCRVTEIDGRQDWPAAPVGQVHVGVHRRGPLPSSGLDVFDILLSAAPGPPRPWIRIGPDRLDAVIADLQSRIAAQPAAAGVVAQLMRMTLALDFGQALQAESLAYSMLLASHGFQTWRGATPIRSREDIEPRIVMAMEGEILSIRLNRPTARNAFDAAMRDALCEALDFACTHPDAPPVTLSGEGLVFSAGGDLNEFGSAADPAEAHLIRTLRSPVSLARDLGGRLTAHLHGDCVGAGIEIPAAAGRVTARAGTVCRLPEVSMGLVPGAGGTASIPRRIGRHRAAYMAISGAAIDLATALDWGLVDAEVA
jgi:hypothetical protein